MLELKRMAEDNLDRGIMTFTLFGIEYSIEHTFGRQFAVMYQRRECRNYKRQDRAPLVWECAMHIYALA